MWRNMYNFVDEIHLSVQTGGIDRIYQRHIFQKAFRFFPFKENRQISMHEGRKAAQKHSHAPDTTPKKGGKARGRLQK